jgi:peroxiredoxin
VLIIEFMQTTCPVCQRLADTLLQVKAKYGDRIGVMSILTLPDNFQTVEKFATDRKIPWPMVFDSGQVMISYLKVTPVNPKVEFPHVFLIDGKGTIRNDFGPAEEAALNVAGLSAEIDKLLK